MQYFYRKLSLKVLLPIILLFSLPVFGQTDISIGNGTTSNGPWEYPCPFQDAREGSRMQYLYKASEMTAAGMQPGFIYSVKFNMTALGDYWGDNSAVEGFALKIGKTATASLASDSWEEISQTAFGPVDYTPVLGLNSFTLATPFFWNGTDNIVIEICSGSDAQGLGSANPSVQWSINLGFNGSHSYGDNFRGNLCNTTDANELGTQTSRPNIVFNWKAAEACNSATLTAGTATTNMASACRSEQFELGLTGYSMATGLSFQWQSSPDNNIWTNITGATETNYKATQNASTYYRAVVTCVAGGTANSASVQVVTPPALSGTFTINNNAPSSATNFQSFRDAYNYIKCGINGPVVFNIVAGSGPYNEQLIINSIPGSSTTNTVTFNGNGAEINFASTATKDRAVIKLNGADYIRFNDLTINASSTGFSAYGFGVQLINDADSNIIHHCIINVDASASSDNYAGIVISANDNSAIDLGNAKCDGNILSDNTITGGKYGITLVGSETTPNTNNKISRNIIKDFDSYGIYVACSFSSLVDSNHISRPVRTDGYNAVNGIYITKINTRLSITKNTITNIYGGNAGTDFYGINFAEAPALGGLEAVVSNNQIYGINGGTNVYGLYNTTSHNVLYYHNTISLDGTGDWLTKDNKTTGIYVSDATGVVYNNNNIVVTRAGAATNTAIWFNTGAGDTRSDNNNFFVSGSATTNQIGYSTNAGKELLSDWTAATAQDVHSLSADPMFVSLATGDLAPANPALDNAGANVGITVDIKGVARNVNTPDIGAYEITTPACVTPPTAGTTVLSKDAVCVTGSVAISLTGNSIGAGQTYQLESSTAAAGPFVVIGNVSTNPSFAVTATVSTYYRVAVNCGGSKVASAPILLTVYQAVPAGSYTINKNAAASATNFTSFNAAYQSLDCGIAGPIVFNVVAGSGPYNEQLILKQVKGASAANTITFKGNGNTLQFSSDESLQRAVVKLDGADHFILDSINIDATGAGAFGYGVEFIRNADSNIVRNSTITANTSSTEESYAGIVMSASDEDATATGDTWCDNNLIEKNTIVGGYYGVTIVGDPAYFEAFSNFINDNKVIGNKISDFHSRGIYIIGTANSVIEGNNISRPSRTTLGAFYGMYVSQTNGGLKIQRNKISNPFGGNTASTQAFYGIYFDFASHETKMEITNNLIYNVNGAGTQTGFYLNSGRNTDFYHNTLSFDNKANTSANGTTGFYMASSGEGNNFSNNIITITRGGGGLKYGVFVSGDIISTLRADYNDYYIKGAGGNNYIGYRTSGQATLEQWRYVTAKDQHSISADPVYTNPAIGAFAPTVAPVDNKGTPLGIVTDIDGAVRSTTTPDMGAYEFSAAACISGVIAGTATATPNNGICMGTPVKLTLTGNTVSGSQVYKWQVASSANGPWAYVGDSAYVPEFETEVLGNSFFRSIVSCSGISDTSSTVQVQLNAGLPGGIYTIKKDGTGDYPSFKAAVAAMNCGIAGAVTFNVSPGTYNEQVLMRRVAGASATNRITFQSANGTATSVILTAASTADTNYVLKLDSASYITYKNISITASSAANGRVVVLSGNSSYDSISNNIITAPAATAVATTRAAIFADQVKGDSIVISGNTVSNGSTGIYVAGTNINRNKNLVIEGNILKGFYQYGIYSRYANYVKVAKNTVTMARPLNATAYGIYVADGDSSFNVTANEITISNTTTTAYGIDVLRYNSVINNPGKVEANKVIAATTNTGSLYGIYTSDLTNGRIINNVVSVQTSGSNSYGLYGNNNINASIFNNSILSTSTSSGDNVAGYFTDEFSNIYYSDIRNNIFSSEGGGKALFLFSIERFYSDYNLLYSTGDVLVEQGNWDGRTYANLQEWKELANLDVNSIVYKPAFTSNTNLEPNVAASDVWAIHGRGEQLVANDYDINNNARPVALKAGVPDLGAYEFVPTSVPPIAIADPATPAANTRQVFMFGTDTVCAINWGATVPQSITIKRYSGVTPPGLAAGAENMFFYIDADATGAGNYNYSIDQKYIDPWRGLIDREERIRLGRTDASATWLTDSASKANIVDNIISMENLSFIDKITGLTNGKIGYPATDSIKVDSSNLGTRFWVGYGKTDQYGVDNMVIYMGGGEKDANVTVKVHGTNWSKNYFVPANSFITSDAIPRAGVSSALLKNEGFYDRAISIESDEPIAAYAHASNWSQMASAMLLPTTSYGYEYKTLAFKQLSYESLTPNAWFYVIADHDSTQVEITPSNPTAGGRLAGVPFVITLNKGEVYNLLGGTKSVDEGFDLSGSTVRSISNPAGKCYPVAVFSGNSDAFIDCDSLFVPSGDYLLQQNLPYQSWGTEYITAPTSNGSAPTVLMTNYYRVLVKDPTTVVKRNGVVLTGLQQQNFYEFASATADDIQADKPIMVAQFMPGSSNVCNIINSSPEMIYVVPADRGIKKASFYRTSNGISSANLLTAILPTAGVSSLLIDGSNKFDSTYLHPNKPGYTVVIKSWDPENATSTIQSDSTFTAVTYAADFTSYGYAIGTMLNVIKANPGITNKYDSSGNYSAFTCVGTPFKYSLLLPVQPSNLVWKFSKATNGVPNADSVQVNPVAVDTVTVNNRTYYKYALQGEYIFPAVGQYTIPVEFTNPVVGNCSNTMENTFTVNVVGTPVANFDSTFTGCMNDVAQFTGRVTASNGDAADKFNWSFGDNTTSTGTNVTKQYATADTFNVKLDVITKVGCVASVTKPIIVKGIPAVVFVKDTVESCPGSDVVLEIKDPATGVVYTWYDALTAGTLVHTGSTYTVPAVTGTKNYFVEASLNGCSSTPRQKVTATLLPDVAVPIAKVDSVGTNLVRFSWNAVAGVTAYQVSTDAGATWGNPSSGAAGLTHTVTGLRGGVSVTLQVKAIDPNACEDGVSTAVTGTTLPDQLFIPNAFSPNGDGLNDVFKVEGYTIRSLRMTVFNQWGEKIFESADQSNGWNGTHKGKLQPSGVYMYVVNITLNDGSNIVRKGSVNLVR